MPKINLIATTNGSSITLYQNLKSAEPDSHWYKLQDNEQGIVAYGFSSAYGVIVRHKNNPRNLSFAFVTDHFDSEDPTPTMAFYKELVQAVDVDPDNVTVEVVRSIDGYTEQFVMENVPHDDSGEMLNSGNLSPQEFFSTYDAQYREFFHDVFHIEPVFTNLPSAAVVITQSGALDTLPNFSFSCLSTTRVYPQAMSGFFSEPIEQAEIEQDEDTEEELNITGLGH